MDLREVEQRRMAVETANDAVERATRALGKAKEALDAALRARPEEPSESHIAFTLQFEPYGPAYSYAAHRPGRRGFARWYTTGSTCPPNGYSWDELVDLIESAETIIERPRTLQNSNVLPGFTK